jgi:ankyrin repeat protein
VHGWTALIYAANSSFSDDSTNIKEIVKVLLASGADVNVGDLQGKTALDYASHAITELLISAGAIKL